MKLVSSKTELSVLKACTSNNPSVSGTILSGTDSTYFYNDYTQEAYERVQELVRQNGEVPSWKELLADPELGEQTRKRLAKAEIDKVKDRDQALRTVRILNKYRQLRGAFTISESINKQLKADSVKIDKLLDFMSNEVGKLRQVKAEDATVIRFGKGNNATGLVKKLLNKDEDSNFIPTGFNEYDDKNGGAGFGNLFTIGGSSGAGKSTLAAQLGINWSRMGEHVCMVPLEMTADEMVARTMANAAQLDVRKILHRKLSEDEERLYMKSYKKFVKARKKSEGTLSFFKPKSDMTIEEILACTYTMGPSIIIVDYISLLKGIDGDDAWQKLGAVARYCKVYAETHNVLIVMLCQVSEEGKIRYAQSIKEHSNICWTFVANKDTREAGVMNISQLKARNGELYDFTLKTDMARMTVRSMSEEERSSFESGSNTTKKNRGGKDGKEKEDKKSKRPAYLTDVSDEE